MSIRVVKRAYKYRFYPTPQQAELLNRTLGSVRYVYNRALAERSRAWTQEHKRVTFAETCRMLTAWKNDADTAWLYQVSNVALQQGLQHLQNAYVNFWGKRAKYPTFKSKHKSRASATFTTSGFRYRDGRIWLAKTSEPLAIVLVPAAARRCGTVHGHGVSRDAAGRWHISILAECPVQALPPADRGGGDRRGDHVPGHAVDRGEGHQPEARAAGPGAAGAGPAAPGPKQKGSANRAKAQVKVARVYARITDRSRDYLHKLSTRIIRENQTVIIEDLPVRNMVRNHSLARAISDASWSEFRRQLEYKADWYGRTVIAVDRFYPSSKTCSACGVITAKMPLNVREWACAACGVLHDRDVNAAKVIRAEGLSVQACGDGVRPART